MNKLSIPLALLVLGILAFFQKQNASFHQISGNTMGTSYTVKFTGKLKKERTYKIKKNMEDILENIESKMSTYLSQSEISLFNKIKSTLPYPVSSETAFVVDKALAIGKLSMGAFDITTGPLVNLWGFGHKKKQTVTSQKIKSLLALKKQSLLIVDTKKNTLQKKIKNLQIDLSGIAKGYAVDLLVDF